MSALLPPQPEIEVAIPGPCDADVRVWRAAPDGDTAPLSSTEIENLLTSDLNSRFEIGMGAPL